MKCFVDQTNQIFSLLVQIAKKTVRFCKILYTFNIQLNNQLKSNKNEKVCSNSGRVRRL